MHETILVVDDDAHIREVVGFALQNAGFHVVEAHSGAQALDLFARSGAKLVVLDIGMPMMDGFEVCRRLRKESEVPVIFLTARADEVDRVLAFELGADDHVAKPFSPRELVLRVKRLLKRAEGSLLSELDDTATPPPPIIEHGGIRLDEGAHSVTVNGSALALTATEFQILKTLVSAPGRVFSKPLMIDAVYGHNIHVTDRTLDSHVRNLRAKARDKGIDELVTTVHGVGIRLADI